MSSREDVRAPLLAHLPNEASDKSDQCGMIWDRGDFLPWDMGVPNPTLVDVLTDRKDLIVICFKRGTPAEKKKRREEEEEGGRKERRKALVPGCGWWCDVILLASLKYDAYDFSKSLIRLSSLCV